MVNPEQMTSATREERNTARRRGGAFLEPAERPALPAGDGGPTRSAELRASRNALERETHRARLASVDVGGTASGPLPSRSRIFCGRMLAAREKELQRLSKELHDGLGQTLIVTKFTLEDAIRRVQRRDRAECGSLLQEAVLQLRGVIGEVRRIAEGLRPSSLDDLGLIPALAGHCRAYRRIHGGITLRLDIGIAESGIPSHLKVDIFRIVQEALDNVARHSHAASVSASLLSDSTRLCLRIVDDGAGFLPDALADDLASEGGMGVHGMRDRVEASGGQFRIHAPLGGGTAVEAFWVLEGAASRPIAPRKGASRRPRSGGGLMAAPLRVVSSK